MTKSIKNNGNNVEFFKLGKEIVELLFFIFCSIVFYYFVTNYLGVFSNYKQFVIASNSMNPVIKAGDIVTVNTNCKKDDLEINDIIAFYQDINNDCENEVIVHYIAAITVNEQNERVFLTRAAYAISQSTWDNWEVSEYKIIGKYVFHLPMLGKFFIFAKSGLGKFIIIYNAIIVCIIVKVFRYKEVVNS